MTGLGKFLTAYFDAAIWSSTADDGQPLDSAYVVDDIDPATLARLKAEAAAWHDLHWDDLSVIDDDSQAGHDFWLTRNGHGAGFWDGDWPEPQATRLTDAANKAGEVDLYVGDDGKIHADPIGGAS